MPRRFRPSRTGSSGARYRSRSLSPHWLPGSTTFWRQAPRAGPQLAQHRPVRPGAAGAPERVQLLPGAADRDPVMLADGRDVPPLRRGGRSAPVHELGATFGGLLATVSTRHTFPFFTALVSTVGPASSLERRPMGHSGLCDGHGRGSRRCVGQQGLLALSIGDQMGNLLTPFWAAVGAGIARIDFRRFIGYQFAYAAIWFVLGVLIFTLLPA